MELYKQINKEYEVVFYVDIECLLDDFEERNYTNKKKKEILSKFNETEINDNDYDLSVNLKCMIQEIEIWYDDRWPGGYCLEVRGHILKTDKSKYFWENDIFLDALDMDWPYANFTINDIGRINKKK